MSNNVVINKPLASMGLSQTHQFLSAGEAQKHQGSIASLAQKMGIPKQAVEDLLTRNVSSLPSRGGATLKRMENYLQQALDKSGTAKKGNQQLVQTYLTLVQQARQVSSPNKSADAHALHQILSDAYTSIAVDHAKQAATHTAGGRVSALSNDANGVSRHQSLAAHHKQQSSYHLAQAHSLAPTDRGKDAVRLMGQQVRSTQSRFDKK